VAVHLHARMCTCLEEAGMSKSWQLQQVKLQKAVCTAYHVNRGWFFCGSSTSLWGLDKSYRKFCLSGTLTVVLGTPLKISALKAWFTCSFTPVSSAVKTLGSSCSQVEQRDISWEPCPICLQNVSSCKQTCSEECFLLCRCSLIVQCTKSWHEEAMFSFLVLPHIPGSSERR
jgi:hypothetical protein